MQPRHTPDPTIAQGDHELIPFVGVKIYYGDGSIHRLLVDTNFPIGWANAPGENVQVVNLYALRTYKTNHIRYPYICCLTGHDFFWWSPTVGFGAAYDNKIATIPEDAEVKRGKLIADADYLAIYNTAHNDRFF